MADKIKDVVDNLKIRKFREIGNGTISRVLEKKNALSEFITTNYYRWLIWWIRNEDQMDAGWHVL